MNTLSFIGEEQAPLEGTILTLERVDHGPTQERGKGLFRQAFTEN